MKVMHRRPAALVASAVLLLGTAALFLGAGSASAASGLCRTDGTTGDVTVDLPGVVFAQVDDQVFGSPYGYGVWACVIPPDQGGGVGLRDPNPANPTGIGFESSTCGNLTSGCVLLAGMTGAEVNPTTGTNAPLDATTAGSGGSLGIGSGTCTWINGTPNCPTGFTIAGVTVNEADLVPSVTPYTPTPPCTGVNNTCVPVGGTVRMFQDTSNPTVTVETATSSSPTNVDVAPSGTCVQVNATC